MANIITENRFPYYSHAFGCDVRDRAHLKALEKRYRVVPATEGDIERNLARVQAEDEAVQQRLDEGDDRIRQAWHYADYRRSIDSGAAVKDLPPEKRERARQQLLNKYCKEQ